MSSEHISINASSSNEESDDNTLLPTPTNTRHTTLTEETIIEKSSDDEDILNHLPTHQFKKKSISFPRKRTNSTKYTTSDNETTDQSGDEADDQYNKKQTDTHKRKLLYSICIIIGCLLLTATVVAIIYWYENSIVNQTEKSVSQPELDMDSELTNIPTTTEILTDEISTTSTVPITTQTSETSSYESTYKSTTQQITTANNTTTTNQMTSQISTTRYMTTNNIITAEPTTTTTSPTYITTESTTISTTTGVPITTTATAITMEATTTTTAIPTSTNPLSNTIQPTVDPTSFPTIIPSIHPTTTLTPAPVSMILRSGNTVIEQGITMVYPPEAFPDSIIEIIIGEANGFIKQIYDESTSVFLAMNIDDIKSNYFLFKVQNDPLSTNDISYLFNIPIPNDLIVKCPNDYGFEIFVYEEQNGFDSESWPVMVLYESIYNETTNSLIAEFYTEMWINKEADMIVSCTPGNDAGHVRRRRNLLHISSSEKFSQTKDDSKHSPHTKGSPESKHSPDSKHSHAKGSSDSKHSPDSKHSKPDSKHSKHSPDSKHSHDSNNQISTTGLFVTTDDNAPDSKHSKHSPDSKHSHGSKNVMSTTQLFVTRSHDSKHSPHGKHSSDSSDAMSTTGLFASTDDQVLVTDECHASTLECPISCKSKQKLCEKCKVLKEFSRTHVGVDYAVNDCIVAAAIGIIEKSYTSPFFDEVIVLRHLDGSATIYKNLESRLVLTNDSVNVGDVIATGESHLHFEYVPNGELFTRKGYIDANACIIKNKHQTGSIQVSNSKTSKYNLDFFKMYIDGYFICQATNGKLNMCTINNLKCGVHELSIQIISEANGCDKWSVKLLNGWTFDDGNDSKNGLNGEFEKWNINVPCN